MKINLVSPQFYPAISYGGPVFSTLNTARELVKQGNEIHVSTTNANWDTRLTTDTARSIELEKSIFVHYYHDTFLNRVSIPLLKGLYNDIKKCDIVFLQYIFSISTPISLLLAKWHGKPVLLSPRGSLAKWILKHGKRKNEWLKYFIKPFAKAIHWHATSQMEQNDILNLFPTANIHILPNCLEINDYTKFNPLNRTEFLKKFIPSANIPAPSHIAVSMGRLQKKKGFDILIKSFARVKAVFPDSILIIAGKDEGELLSLEELIKSRELENSIFFCGHIQGQDKVDFLNNADVFALTSHNENFGNVYAEALACGLPLVASKKTPWEEIEKYNCGRWVKKKPKNSGKAIIEILKKGKNFYSQNCKTYVQKFSGENVGKSFDQIAKAIILEKNNRR